MEFKINLSGQLMMLCISFVIMMSVTTKIFNHAMIVSFIYILHALLLLVNESLV